MDLFTGRHGKFDRLRLKGIVKPELMIAGSDFNGHDLTALEQVEFLAIKRDLNAARKMIALVFVRDPQVCGAR